MPLIKTIAYLLLLVGRCSLSVFYHHCPFHRWWGFHPAGWPSLRQIGGRLHPAGDVGTLGLALLPEHAGRICAKEDTAGTPRLRGSYAGANKHG